VAHTLGIPSELPQQASVWHLLSTIPGVQLLAATLVSEGDLADLTNADWSAEYAKRHSRLVLSSVQESERLLEWRQSIVASSPETLYQMDEILLAKCAAPLCTRHTRGHIAYTPLTRPVLPCGTHRRIEQGLGVLILLCRVRGDKSVGCFTLPQATATYPSGAFILKQESHGGGHGHWTEMVCLNLSHSHGIHGHGGRPASAAISVFRGEGGMRR